MAKRRRNRRAVVVAVGLTLLTLAAIALLIARPARVVGVTEGSLADSLQGEVEAALGPKGTCEEAESGRPHETVWRCSILRKEKSPGLVLEYSVRADEWGCWDAKPVSDEARDLSSCIWLMDFIRVVG